MAVFFVQMKRAFDFGCLHKNHLAAERHNPEVEYTAESSGAQAGAVEDHLGLVAYDGSTEVRELLVHKLDTIAVLEKVAEKH